MIVKCNKKLSEYKYLVSFDLASHNTGVCLWNISLKKPEKTFLISVQKSENFVFNLYQELVNFFNYLEENYCSKKEIFVCKEAMPLQLRGGSSTVQTFLALAKSHAILDFFLQQNGIDVYDYIGIYPATTHACLKKIMCLDSKATVDKKMINEYILNTYNISTKTFDESDAAFLAVTLISTKWNRDLCEQIKENKKHIKGLSSQKTIEDWTNRNVFLENLKI